MSRNKEKLLAAIAYEKACEDVKSWFCAYHKGMEACVTLAAVRDLEDRITIRDDLRNEVYPAGQGED